MFNNTANRILANDTTLLSKCVWVAWGFALYYDQENNNSDKDEKYNHIKTIAKGSSAIISSFSQELNLIKKKFKTQGSLINTLTYSTFEIEKELYSCCKEQNRPVNIAVGHAADKICNQIKALNDISFLNKFDVKIYCPLIYGPKNIIENTINVGKEIFNKKFIPLTNKLTLNEYDNFLKKMDIGIYDLKRQRAGANILRMLSLGKKVYISESITTYNSLKKHGFVLFPIKNKESYEGILTPLQRKYSEHNFNLSQKLFSKDAFLNGWLRILSH